MIAKNPGVPEKANTRLQTAVTPSVKDGWPKILTSETHGPSVIGAAAGRSRIATAMVTIMTRNL